MKNGLVDDADVDMASEPYIDLMIQAVAAITTVSRLEAIDDAAMTGKIHWVVGIGTIVLRWRFLKEGLGFERDEVEGRV